MEIIFRSFGSFQEAAAADYAYYRSLSGEERLRIALEIMQPFYAAYPRFERVYRVVELMECPVCGIRSAPSEIYHRVTKVQRYTEKNERN